MKAIKIQPGATAAVMDVPVPRLRPDCVIVKTVAVALNPVDWKHIHFVPKTEGCTVGSDFAGVVRKVGANVSTFRPGDRVAGWTHGGNVSNHEDGSFADYVLAKEGVMLKIPDGVSFTEAATLGVGISTVCQGLYQSLSVPLPNEPLQERLPLLVYGGSTATGTLAIQFAKMSGLDVITTCSPQHHSMVESLGAKAVFDYKSPTVGKRIRTYTDNKLYHAFDCISTDASARICADALSDDVAVKTPIYSSVLYCAFPRQDVHVNVTVAHTIFGKSFFKPGLGPEDFPASDEDYEFGKRFWQISEKLLAEGKFKVHPPDARAGGLEAVLEGLNEIMRGEVSGKKLVFMLSSAGQDGVTKS
ncbi:putative zinc-binding oxidoreductase ToxD [Didymella exigua CBS 183.55]|uniref:Putative zinc-binding oxidoreductase ToxD n=1 Tax=Didymella exigua CBS 183.55 TaxID=1150837 RepID=A0A6A5S1E3_9PLEO|nr:putative zinc-binding oxidoreductase ToxD [Didymella exigua CBS 183.55]KAF1934461.1 putative zinc-binding oxidoreductase ToxD [Didymella exigua CBS 183.55]